MLSKEECRAYIEKLNKEYLETQTILQEREELIPANENLQNDAIGYHGREIFELLQNADDAYQKSIDEGHKPDENLEVKISFFDNVFTISNTGTFFSKEGILAIIQGHNSDKKYGKYIGSKGTGFRSVINWAKVVRIFSGNFDIEFSQEIAESYFNQIKDSEQVKKQLKKKPELSIPMLSVAKYMGDNNIYPENETTIEIVIDPDKLKDEYGVKEQLESIDTKILLFLPNVDKITIQTEDMSVEYSRVKVMRDSLPSGAKCSSVILTKKDNNTNTEEKEEYDLFEKAIKDKFIEDKKYKEVDLAIAVPKDDRNIEDSHLYTYFPLLDTSTPFKCIMHATYQLSDQRNTLVRSENNKNIILEQLDFLLEISSEFYVKNGDKEKAMDIIIPVNINSWNYCTKKFVNGFHIFDLAEEYLKKLESFPIFPTVNGELISLADNPILIDGEFPDFIRGEKLSKYLRIRIEDSRTLTFLNCLKQYFRKDLSVNEGELCDCVSDLSVDWDIYTRVECFAWWAKEYTRFLPNLLIKNNGEWLEKGEKCYFLDGNFDNNNLPEWTKLCVLDRDYQLRLLAVAKKDPQVASLKGDDTQAISRIVSSSKIYSAVDFACLDTFTVIGPMNSSVNSYDEAVEFVKWLWNNQGKKEKENWQPDNKLKYNFPTKNKTIKNSDMLYFSDDYDNEFAKNLFINGYEEFCDYSEFGIPDEYKQDFMKFVSKFKVNKYPRVEEMEITDCSYLQYVENKILPCIPHSPNTGIKNLSYSQLCVKNIEAIVSQLSTEQVLKWIILDSDFRSLLHRKEIRCGEYSIMYRLNRGGGDNKYLYNSNCVIDNYVLSKLNTIKWISIGDDKFAPSEILIDLYSRANHQFRDVTSVITYDIKEQWAKDLNVSIDELNEILNIFAFRKNPLELSSENFYRLMLELPEIDNKQVAADLYRSIYRLIENTTSIKDFGDSTNKTNYFKYGKLLTKKQEFVTASDVYLPSSKIVNKNKYHIIDKGQRGNTDRFISIFGCKKYEREFTIDFDSITLSDCDQVFQKDFFEFKEFASAYNYLNQNIEKAMPKLSIKLVSNIKVKYSDSENYESVTEDYVELSEESTKWYVVVESSSYDINRLSVCIENIFSNIANTPGYEADKIGEVFRSRTREDRAFLINKNCGLVNYNVNDYSLSIKKNFEQVISKIDSDIDIDEYDIDYNNLDSCSSIIELKKLLDDCGINSLAVLYENGFETKIDLNNYYKVYLRNYIDSHKLEYKNYLYSVACVDGLKQSQFLVDYYKYVDYQLETSVADFFDLEKFIKDKFPMNPLTDIKNADEDYSQNYLALNPDNKFADSIANNRAVQTMIYFNHKDEFEQWMLYECKKQEPDKKHNIYEKYEGVIPVEGELIVADISTSEKKRKYHGSYSDYESSAARRAKKIIGNKGELVICNLLESKGYVVIKRSEAFVEVGKLTSGQAESAYYDMEYTDEQGNQHYVEVKTGNGSSFDISPEELEFAKQYKDFYDLYIVYNIDSEKPEYVPVDKEFWNSDNFAKKEIIETIHFDYLGNK